jgi:hypothetical protein
MVTLEGSPVSVSWWFIVCHLHTSKTSDVLLNPMKCQPLVLKSKIGHTCTCNIISIQEPERTKSIGDAGGNNRLSDVDGILNNE